MFSKDICLGWPLLFSECTSFAAVGAIPQKVRGDKVHYGLIVNYILGF